MPSNHQSYRQRVVICFPVDAPESPLPRFESRFLGGKSLVEGNPRINTRRGHVAIAVAVHLVRIMNVNV
jgi:hypothetical protein